MKMFQNRGAVWIGFEEAQKTIKTLKEEVEEAERKLSKAKQSLKHDRGDSNRIVLKPHTTPVNGVYNASKKNQQNRHFVKEILPIQQHHLEQPHRKRGKFTIPTAIRLSSDSESHPSSVPSTAFLSSSQDKKLSSSKDSYSVKIVKQKSSSSEKTSSMIADNYTGGASKLSSKIDRNNDMRNEDASKIKFTSWEENFLKPYIDLGDVEVVSSKPEKPLENITNDMEWTPVLGGGKLPRSRRITDDGLLTLKQIIDRQKRLHEEACSNSGSRVSPSENLNPPTKSDPVSKTPASEEVTYADIEAEAQIRPPPARKVRLVTTLPRYRGFSAPGNLSAKNTQTKHQKKSRHSTADSKTSVCRQTKKTFSNKRDDAVKTLLLTAKKIVPKAKVLQSKDPLTEIQLEEKSYTNSYTKTSDIDSKTSSSKENDSKIIESRIPDKILLENDKENVEENYSININSKTESQVTSVETADKTERQNSFLKFSPVSKSVKRKSFKVHAEEKMAPSPKIRHYDTKAVRDYIKKKKVERRKRHLEEHKKSVEQAEKKKESLQKLFNFQKQNLALPSTRSPSKIHQKKIELKSKNIDTQCTSELQLQQPDKTRNLPAEAISTFQKAPDAEKLPDNESQTGVHLNLENTRNTYKISSSETFQSNSHKEVSCKNVPDFESKTPTTKRKISTQTKQECNEKDFGKSSSFTLQHLYSKQEVSFTSCEYQSTNLSDYISSVSSPSSLSQFPSLDKMLPQKSEKNNLPTVKLKQAEALKNLVKSIDEMTAPYEHLIRTRAWVEQSPPPPNRKSAGKRTSEKVPDPQRTSKVLRDSTDFAVNVAKSLHSHDNKSFLEQVKDIGDVSELYERILQPDNQHKQDYKITHESPKITHERFTEHDHSLVEGSLTSEDSFSNENAQMDSSQTNLKLAPVATDFSELQTLQFNPDPLNFINTWNRKPLGFPSIYQEPSRSASQSTRSIDSKSVNIKSSIYVSDTSFSRPSLHSSFVSNITENFQSSKEQSVASRPESEVVDETLRDETSSHKTTQSNYTSFGTRTSASEASSPEDQINDQTITDQQQTNKLYSNTNQLDVDVKAASPSESSVSEVVSVIANSKNGENGSSGDLVKTIDSSKTVSSRASPVEGNASVTNFQNLLSGTVKSKYESGVSDPSEESLSGFIEEEIPEEVPPEDGIGKKEVNKNSEEPQYSSDSPEMKSPSTSPESKELVQENSSEFSTQSKNSVTIDFTQPVRVTLSNGVPKSIKAIKGSMSQEEQYLNTQVITRVASEAAAAAASSAVIAVFETQKRLLSKEHDANRLFPVASGSKDGHQTRSKTLVSHKTSSWASSSSNERERFQQVSEDIVMDEINEKFSSISTVHEDSNLSIEGSLSEHASLSNKASTSTIVSEHISEIKSSKKQKNVGSRKMSSNLSSPSPASLSENDSISSAAIVSTASAPPSSTISESALSDDSFARLTEDVVRKMSYEEQRRANHQIAVLKSEENTLVENARAQMALLESIKKKLRNKGADTKVSLIKKRQKELILRLRQERAQLRCMQEAYRSMSGMHHTMLNAEKKLPTGRVASQHKNKGKEMPRSSKTSFEEKIESSSIQSDSSSTSAVMTEEESKEIEEETEVNGLEIQMNKSLASTSQDSIVETVASEKIKSSVSSRSQTPKVSPNSLPHAKHSLPLLSNHSNETPLQGMKKLEASKRHLTKREQRILQRRKDVEKLLQWQMKLDSEEMAVRELEQKALELVDNSKKKTKYYVSSSPSATPNDEKKSLLDVPSTSLKISDDIDKSVPSDNVTSQITSKSSVPKTIQSDSIPVENASTTSSGVTTDIALSKKQGIGTESSAISSSSIQEVEKSASPNSSIKTAENTAESSCIEEAMTNETSLHLKSDLKNASNSDAYSESFESAMSQTLSPESNSNGKKERSVSIQSPLGPRNSKRHDSSGSDDSYTISHSETASDQSDIEVRIHALSEELRRRRYEAEKLKKEQKRKYREHLKGKELSLQKQVEAYNQFIHQVKSELDQIESVPSQPSIADISSVKPQIKWPRSEHVADSRRIRKKSYPPDPVRFEKRSIDHMSSSPESADSSLDFPMKQGKLVSKKLFAEVKERSSLELNSKKSILEKSELKTTESKETIPTERSTSDLISEIRYDATPDRASDYSKEEIDVEEFNESNSSIKTVDSTSDKSNVSVKDMSFKTTYQSDSFVLSSSNIPETPKDNEKLKEAVQESTNSLDENVELSAEVPTDSEISHASVHTALNESVNSPEDYTSESSLNTLTHSESVKEDVTSVSIEEENTDDTSTPSSKKSFDDKFSTKAEVKLPVDKALKEDIASQEKQPLKDVKSETFIVNVVTYLSSSMLEDAIRTIINLYKPEAPLSCITTTNSSSPSSVKKLTGRCIQIIINDLLNFYIKDAFQSAYNITNELKLLEGNKPSKEITDNNNKVAILNSDSTKSLNPKLKNDLALTPIPEKVESTIFKKQPDWLEDGFITTPWDPQQLDQQLLLQQYPYLYRKIPNKPPPPYTPPANGNAPSTFPFQVRREKPVEKVDPVKHMTKNIDLIVDSLIDCLLLGKRKGLMIRDITQPDLSSIVEQLDLRNPVQITFLDMIFDLTKETVLDIYSEKEEKQAPWIKPRKLTPKPRFPNDKDKLKARLLQEVKKALKLLPTESYAEQKKKKPTWSTMKLGRKKRDFVDTILISEIKEEEPDWINYDQEEVSIKSQIADSIFDLLVADTVRLVQEIESEFL